MAAPTLVHSQAFASAGQTTRTTSTFTLTAGRTYVIVVGLARGAGIGGTAPTVTWNGESCTYRGRSSQSSASSRTILIYTLVPAGGATAGLVVTRAGADTWDNILTRVEERVTTDVDAAAPFVKITSNTDTSTATPSVSYTMTSGNKVMAYAMTFGGEPTVSAYGWTGVTPLLALGAGDNVLAGQYKDTDDTTSGLTWSGSNLTAMVVVELKSSGGTAALTGTMTTAPNHRYHIAEDGGKTIVITLTGDTWVASGATFDAQRQNIINGLTAGNSTANGWNEVVKAGLPVTAVVRTSNTVVTITLPAFATYAPAATQTITVTVPSTAVSLAAAIVATPTITTYRGPLASIASGTTDGSGVLTFTVTNDDPNTANGEYTETVATVDAVTARTSNRFA